MKEVKGSRDERGGMEEEEEEEERSNLADCCVSLLTEGNMTRISRVMKRGGGCGTASRKPPCLLRRILQAPQRSGRFSAPWLPRRHPRRPRLFFPAPRLRGGYAS